MVHQSPITGTRFTTWKIFNKNFTVMLLFDLAVKIWREFKLHTLTGCRNLSKTFNRNSVEKNRKDIGLSSGIIG